MTADPSGLPRRALITGATGQDGSYLCELLLQKGYVVVAGTRDPGAPRARRLARIVAPLRPEQRFRLVPLDLTRADEVARLLLRVRPHEVYHLASQSHVGRSFHRPFETFEANARGALVLLESARRLQDRHDVRVFQASSSEIFGAARESPQNEQTPFRPRNPYACTKVYAFHQAVVHRERFGLFVSNGILFNHESPRRSPRFVTRKITRAAARIAAGLDCEVRLGNIDVGRDWGFAPEYVDAMWRMLQHKQPDDFVIATNGWHTLTEFLEIAFNGVGRDWRDCVRLDPALRRPPEETRLQGDFRKAERELGWRPQTSFEELVRLMVESDVAAMRRRLRE